MDPITHFSHEHPLHLLQQKPTEEEKSCYACEVPLNKVEEHLVEVYGCDLCKDFFLHKHCAELPMEIMHKLHENHSLFLVLKPPGSNCEGYCSCPQGPHYNNSRFFYFCYVCDYLLYVGCAFREKYGIVWQKKDLTFHHPSHKLHPLMVLPRPASLLCDACGVKGEEDLFYYCSTCQYWIHKRCAMLPTTTTLHIHKHPLTLSFLELPIHHRQTFSYVCDICGENLNWNRVQFWVYYCDLCRYFVHIRCMGKKNKQIEVDLEGLHIEDLPHLPITDESEGLIRRFFLEKNTLEDIQSEIQIFSHRHPLVYSNDQFPEDGEEILVCDACVEQINSPQYYHCPECKYFLHIPCAKLKLPLQLQLPTHPHQLSLGSKTRFDEIFECNRCERKSNGFFFYCTTEGCELHLDLSCAALPKVILHEGHNHPLVQLPGPLVQLPDQLRDGRACSGCSDYQWEYAWMACTPCNFFLHVECALLPKTVKHRFDSKHPLLLRFPPHDYHPNPFDCYQCDDEINPSFLLYHCEECDLSLHVRCINVESEKDYKMKFGQEVQIGSHPHPLKFVYEASVSSSRCHNCEGDNANFTLECKTCNFRLCRYCIKEIELPN